jgi:hypothetical protein
MSEKPAESRCQSFKSGAREVVSLVCGELVEAGLRQAAATLLVEEPETVLSACVSLICGELVEADVRFKIADQSTLRLMQASGLALEQETQP